MLTHRYVRTILVQVLTEVASDGSDLTVVAVDTDLTNLNDVIAYLERAKLLAIDGDVEFHEAPMDLEAVREKFENSPIVDEYFDEDDLDFD